MPHRPPPPSGYMIALHWAKAGEFVYDLGEPSCFACGWFNESKPTVPDVTCTQAWAKSGLERAHLRPHSLGGRNEPANYVMLCPPCHAEAPDWCDPNEMLAWVHRRENFVDAGIARLKGAWESVRPGVPFPGHLARDPELKSRLAVVLNASATTHAARLSWSTVALALAQVAAPSDVSPRAAA